MARTYYDFFAGGGMCGVGLGAGWICNFANDIDAMKASIYQAYHGHAVTLKDVRKLNVAELPGSADLTWASFPCQDLSLAGNGAGLNGERSGMFWPFWHLVRALDKEQRAPRVIVLENVLGILTSNGGRDFATIASAFSGRGYRFGALVIDAAKFVPQSRPRVFIVGVRKDLRPPAEVMGYGPSAPWHPRAVQGAYEGLSKAASSKWIWWHLPEPPRRNVGLSDLIDTTPKGVKWHSREETDYLLSLMSGGHLAKVAAMRGMGKRVVGTVYRRTRPDGSGGKIQRAEVRFDDLSGCLRTPGGGSSRQTIIVVDGKSVRSRLLAPREAARLMGLPDDYPLPGRYNDAYHLAGDGVVVPVVRHLAQFIIEPVLDANKSSRSGAKRVARK